MERIGQRPVPARLISDGVFYPDSDGKPLGETPHHIRNILYLVEELDAHFLDDAQTFVAGDMFVYYERGNNRRHVSPDVFVVRGIAKETTPPRTRYLVWKEGKPPGAIVEVTSKSTSKEDVEDKKILYQDTLQVPEYFLYDPEGEYLSPRLQGFRLVEGKYERIEPIDGRLPSEILGLHLEVDGLQLRLYDPATGQWISTPPEVREALAEAETERRISEAARAQAEQARSARGTGAVARNRGSDTRGGGGRALREEVEELRRRLGDQAGQGT